VRRNSTLGRALSYWLDKSQTPTPEARCSLGRSPHQAFENLSTEERASYMEDETKRKNKLDSFVPFPREVFHDLHGGKITPTEYDVYVRIRHAANPYGISTISLEGLLADFGYRGWKDKNYLNKILLSLRRKSYLHYPLRSGHRGSFEVRFPQFSTPDGVLTKAKSGGEGDVVRGQTHAQVVAPSEVRQSMTTHSQSFTSIKTLLQKAPKQNSAEKGSAAYTDTDTENENKYRSKKYWKKTPVDGFEVASHEEERCKEIAIALGEPSMDFLLGTLRQRGLRIIERAWGIYCEQSDKEKITNKAAYFNKIISSLTAEPPLP
jgi:hypothetical protein